MAFQSFDPPHTNAERVRERVAHLRETFAALGVDGIVVPHEDAWQSETLPPSEERLATISGFTGSAGRAIILRESALLATDGRYTLQAEAQVPADLFTVTSDEASAADWMSAHLAETTLGIDPHLHTRADLARLENSARGLAVVRLDRNPVDAIWPERPAPPCGLIVQRPDALAGQGAEEKIAAVRERMSADALLVSASDSVSWLLNWRGDDVAHTPLVLSRAFIPQDGPVTVFLNPNKVPDEVAAALDGVATIAHEDGFLARLEALSRGIVVEADPARTPDAALAAIESGGTLKETPDTLTRLKARKNAAEIAGMRAAHVRDGVAVTRFLAWFDAHAAGATEVDLVERLEAFRVEAGARDVSFDTIAGSGPHGAIVHYRVDRASNRTVGAGDPVLVDSGGQYADGTTDVTRTLCAGEPSDAFRTAFTRVLKAHIALAAQRFPRETPGVQLDGIARAALWNAGLDYAHGTGHGVGAALGVHEGPASISRRGREVLEPGMILSNEPGFYEPGAWGIRIENLVLVTEPTVPPGGDAPMMGFETLTLVPIDTRLIVPELLSAADIGWLDAYHARVRGALVADLDPQTRDWLETRTRPLADGAPAAHAA